jgi:CBS domain containing-hemolysin-like protein
VPLVLKYGYELAAMAILICCSAFFSGSEAALFYLRRPDRRRLQTGNSAQRLAATLLDDPDRLLTAVLFWNLVINITYFAIASSIGIRLERNGRGAEAGAFALSALLLIIFLSEMLPKNLAVLRPRLTAALVSIPLAMTVRILDPIMPSIRFANLVSRRLIFPRFEPEPYLELADLERAIQLSTTDAALKEQERNALQNIVLLSDVRVEELMRPRMQFLSFRPPVSVADLGGRMPPSGYLLVTEPDSDEVAAAVPLKHLSDISSRHLEHFAETVSYVPWCATVNGALDEMHRRDHEVAAVVNEFGETIGILTFDDIFDTIFGDRPSRSARLLQKSPLVEVRPGVWRVTGMTSLRRLAKEFQVALPVCKSVTVAGILQEVLQHMPTHGDRCQWGPFQLDVLDAPVRGHLTVQLTRIPAEGDR